ncbi:RNA polymerase sigma factor SigW [Caldalkalibacillus salinus]|uniref:RNA polymerase sigma factor SigW n=1 Tax=Caldalkalibacillus salinus TaxID=2803787 RepID=UPI00192491C9|nr:RNA polymerase sigma factor SigW [Caldalkalibacillus salinus]
MDRTERKLIKKASAGSRTAFRAIVERYKNKIYHLAYRMLGNHTEAEDVAQETFIRVYTKLDRYNDDHKFSTWIYRIATNLCIDHLRKRKQHVQSLDQEVAGVEGLALYSQVASTTDTPEEEVMTLELREEVQLAIDKLPPQYKTIIILRYLQDLSLQEISEVIDLPVTTIKTRIHRGREALKKQLQNLT